MRSIRIWVETIWELVAALVFLLTCLIWSPRHTPQSLCLNALMPRQKIVQQLPPSLVLAHGEHKTKWVSIRLKEVELFKSLM